MKVHLVDGTYELYRQHYGQAVRHSEPPPLAATIGVLSSTMQLIADGATHIGVATDHVIESFRNDLYDGYKTSEGMEPVLLHQIPLLEDALRALGVTVWAMEEYEADDALGSAARVASRGGGRRQVRRAAVEHRRLPRIGRRHRRRFPGPRRLGCQVRRGGVGEIRAHRGHPRVRGSVGRPGLAWGPQVGRVAGREPRPGVAVPSHRHHGAHRSGGACRRIGSGPVRGTISPSSAPIWARRRVWPRRPLVSPERAAGSLTALHSAPAGCGDGRVLCDGFP